MSGCRWGRPYECVEVATNMPTTIAIRDSKHQHPAGPSLHLHPTTWIVFQTALLNGRL